MSDVNERDSKTKRVRIVGVAGMFALLTAVGIFYFASNASQSSAQVEDNSQTNVVIDVEPTQLPHEIQFRTGIPILRAFEVIDPAESLYFNPIKQDEYPYLWRAVDKGSTFLSAAEMEDYFTTFSKTAYRFAMQTEEGTKYYRIWYSEPPISVDTHWVKVMIYEDPKQDVKSLSDSDRNRLSLAIERAFRWVPVDETDAQSIKNLIDTEGQFFQTITQEGDKTIQVMYLGPLSEELKQPEFQAMYGKEAGQ